ncbi:hypothetical protein M413DRAFT_118629 [Hebeloma cylindrosporum]|uniref:Uncharacterized protein n=1 Tax=Hebeloma cylindrosporum TaxID=76867 RepID=A0A0C2YJE6_HEBCY|nr:hypothetical protein M413DRAFT_118629 [Hebeloma cylindrosporum h7]
MYPSRSCLALSISRILHSVILLITCREYVPSDGNTPNVPQPEVDNSHPRHSLSPFQRARTKENTSLPPELDYSHSAPSFPPPQSAPSTENTGISLHLQDDYRDSPASFSASQSLIEVNTSGPRLSLPHSLCYEISSEGPIDPFHVQTLHNDLSTPAIGFSFTSSFDSPPLPPDFSNLALNNSTYSACLGPSSCTPFNWEQNYEIHSGSDSSASASYFDDSGGYEFSSTRNCLCDRCTLPRLPDFWP